MSPLPDGSGRNPGCPSGGTVLAVAFAVLTILVGAVLIIRAVVT